MGIREENLGKEGQERAKNSLLNFFGARRVFQVDWMSEEYEGFILNEVKEQDVFEPPPFLGQGLPIWQVKARMNFFKITGIRCRLLIFNPSDKLDVLWQWLDELETGKWYDTKGEKPRRVYPITAFHQITAKYIKW